MGTGAFDLSSSVLSRIAARVKYKRLNVKINVLCFSNPRKCSLQCFQTPVYCLSSFKNCALDQATQHIPGQFIHPYMSYLAATDQKHAKTIPQETPSAGP